MPKKKKGKKHWKERQRQRTLRRQRSLEGERERIDQVIEKRHKEKSRMRLRKVLGVVCVIVLILISYGVWQSMPHTQPSTEPPPINPTKPPETPSSTDTAPGFSLRDINGTLFSLSNYKGRAIAIHFMAVGCHGQINTINEHQLTQLKTVCNSYCGDKPFAAVTVAVATCPSSDLAQIRATYGITWFLGNDYDDGKMDIVDGYAAYSINDGTIVLIDKTFHVAQTYSEETTASTLSSRISQLLGA